MSERYLRKEEVAAMLGSSPGVAASILRKAGIEPIDLGRGRGRGLRWLESAVQTAILALHNKAQPKQKKHVARSDSGCPFITMSSKEQAALVRKGCVQ